MKGFSPFPLYESVFQIAIEIQPNSTLFSGNLSVINVFFLREGEKQKKSHGICCCSSIFASCDGGKNKEKKRMPALSKSINNPPLCVCVQHVMKMARAADWGHFLPASELREREGNPRRLPLPHRFLFRTLQVFMRLLKFHFKMA